MVRSTQLVFAPKDTVQPCSFTILDDLQQPRLEGNETFMVVLHQAIGASLMSPYQSVVTIDDTADDGMTVINRRSSVFHCLVVISHSSQSVLC